MMYDPRTGTQIRSLRQLPRHESVEAYDAPSGDVADYFIGRLAAIMLIGIILEAICGYIAR